jgi:hypothetical protein
MDYEAAILHCEADERSGTTHDPFYSVNINISNWKKRKNEIFTHFMRQYYPNVTVIECNKRVRASIQTFENEHV